MNAEIKAKWLKALRSGRYEQGRGRLRCKEDEEHSDSFCCLGVLCDVVAGDKWQSPERKNVTYYICGEGESLPAAIEELAGLEGDPVIWFNGVSKGITQWNDYDRLSFAQLADLIEGQL